MVVAETGIVHFLDLRARQVASTGKSANLKGIHAQFHSDRLGYRAPPLGGYIGWGLIGLSHHVQRTQN